LFKRLDNWFKKQAEKDAKRDVLKSTDRTGNFASIVFTIIFVIFFAVHLSSNTGFFTSGFGAASAALFFIGAGWGIVPSAIRMVTGKRSPSKIPDIMSSILVFFSILYFLSNFTFDFSHLADPLPSYLAWIISWISADLVEILMILGGIALIFVTPFQIVSYRYLRIELAKPAGVPPEQIPPVQNQEAPKP